MISRIFEYLIPMTNSACSKPEILKIQSKQPKRVKVGVKFVTNNDGSESIIGVYAE